MLATNNQKLLKIFKNTRDRTKSIIKKERPTTSCDLLKK